MKIRAWHIWLCSLPPLGMALALPVTRSAWLEGEFDVSGLAAVFWIVLDAILRIARLVTVPSVTVLIGAWFSVAWVLVFASILLSPVTVLSRAPAASGRRNAWLLLQILLFATTYGLALLQSQGVHDSFQFAGYRWLGVALLVLSLAFCMRIVEIRPPARDFTVE